MAMVDPEQKEEPLAVKVSWTNLLVLFGGFVLWLYCIGPIQHWAAFDVNCMGDVHRRGAYLETIVCSAIAGPKGWIYLAWFLWPIVGIIWWLRRKLKAAKKAKQ